MKRIKAACLHQTIHFQLKDDFNDHAAAVMAVRNELEQFKAQLNRRHIPYRILSETVQPDDSIIIQLKKQYNHYDYGTYLDD